MEFKFDPNIDYQLEAIDAAVSVFNGQEDVHETRPGLVAENGAVPNVLTIGEDQILENINSVQEEHAVDDVSDELGSMDFSIEMETGTGKTYVYLRTIMEMYQEYGWRKFMIVVPSVAIREGVIKTLNQTSKHFDELYDKPSYNFYEYDSDNLQQVRNFARSNEIEIMVMTLQSFNKGEDNLMFRQQDSLQGNRPVDFIQKSNPALILDEPQNMESENSKEALSRLNPLFKLRYSATHREKYNILYQLGPYEAYRKGLVKQIDVLSVVKENEFNTRLIEVEDVKRGDPLKAKLNLYKNLKNGITEGRKSVKLGDNLYSASKGVDAYEDLKVTNIDASRNFVEFSDGTRVYEGESTDTDIEKIQRLQIRETLEEHFEKALERHEKGIKVLSLFFIDQVDNYKDGGRLKQAFREEFNKLKQKDRYSDLYGDKTAEDVSGSYFSEYKTEQSIKNDTEAYELIMQDKEELLSLDEPVEFIFSHSALREGWDNPNVFNICTLNNTHSNVRKRQEIGRGVRLPVNQQGDRIFDENINVLTVIANESYDDYVSKLQTQYEEQTGREDDVTERVKDRRDRAEVEPKDEVLNSDEFENLWDNISIKTHYKSDIDTEKLIKKGSEEVSEMSVSDPQIEISKASVESQGENLDYRKKGARIESLDSSYAVPNVIEELSEHLNLTKSTVSKILRNSENLDALFKNPEDFIRRVKEIIGELLEKQVLDDIEYVETEESISKDVFRKLTTYSDRTIEVSKSVYPKIIFDSDGEREFAEQLDNREGEVELFVKLPPDFQIPTPIGPYNPDWAIIFNKKDKRGEEIGSELYLVRETKFVSEMDQLRGTERKKINCAERHFEEIDVDYDTITDVEEKLV